MVELDDCEAGGCEKASGCGVKAGTGRGPVPRAVAFSSLSDASSSDGAMGWALVFPSETRLKILIRTAHDLV